MKTKRLRAKPIIYSIYLLRVLRHVQVKKSLPLDNFSLPRHAHCSQSSFNFTFGLKPQVGDIEIVTV